MTARPYRAAVLALSLAGSAACATPLAAQSRFVVRAPDRPWRTVETAHWTVHYPAAAQPFADCLVPRLEPIHAAVSAVVGYAPAPRITLVIEDAMSFDGAFASANARAPVIMLQTQPSTPRSAGWSDCATARMVHELTHILQLSRPWGPEHPWWRRALVRLLPAEPGPVIFRRQAWLREGYAEYVEARLTAMGWPYTTPTPNALRALALADRLPPYAALSDSYEGQYLVGAAFVSWLARSRGTARAGDSAFAELWRLMAAPDYAGDDAAFTRLFGAPPAALYDRFAAEVKRSAAEVRDRVVRAGLARGERVRDLGWADAVTVSPDGSALAAVTGTPLLRLTAWPAGDTTAAPRRMPVPTGQSASAPRFLPDGRRVLVVQWELVGDGVWRPDLYVHDLETGRLRRVTRGASVRDADPTPDGRAAIGTRCEYGVCDVVRVDLATGAVNVVAAGSPSLAYARPRVSPDGRTAAVAVQSGARSRVGLVDLATGATRWADPDDGAWRYEPAFLRDGRLVVVSEADGIPNVELLDPRDRATRAVTRVVQAAYAPEPDPRGGVYFLRQSTGGVELRHIALGDAPGTPAVVRDSALAPAAPLPLPTPPPAPFPAAPAPAASGYGLGPRWASVVPGVSLGGEGATGTLAVWTSDVVGRLSAMAGATYGTGAAWRGAHLSVAWRGARLPVYVDAAAGAHHPSRQRDVPEDALPPDVRYRGATVRTELERGTWGVRHRLRAGVSAASLGGDEGGRVLAGVDYALTRAWVADLAVLAELRGGVAGGRTGGEGWTRAVVEHTLEVHRSNVARLATVRLAYGTSRGAPRFERFTVGGAASPVVDAFALSQRLSQPLLPAGAALGRRMALVSVTGPRVGPVSPFVWGAAADDGPARWHRIVGLARSFADDPRRNWRVPGARLSTGVGYSLDAPARGRVRGYVTLSFAQ